MSIRRRLSLAFFVILALFALNIVFYRVGNAQRAASFAAVNRAVERQILVSDLEQSLEERRLSVRGLRVIAEVDSASLNATQVANEKSELGRIGEQVESLLALSEDDRPLVESFGRLFGRLEEEWGSFYQSLEVGAVTPEPEASEAAVSEPEPVATEPADSEPGVPEPTSPEPRASAGLPQITGGVVEAEGGEAPPPELAETEAGSEPESTGEEAAEEVPEAEQGVPEPAAAVAPPQKVDIAGLALEQLEFLKTNERRLVGEATRSFDAVAARSDRITLSIFGLSAILALVVAVVVSAHLNRGLKVLKTGVRRIGKGDLDHRMTIRGKDELAELATAFNNMSRNLQVALERVEESRSAAEDASHAKSAFLANMSHELRTPMNAIIGYTEMLTEDAEDLGQEDFIPDLRKILAAGKHLLALINDVLDLSKIEAGKMTLFLEEFEVTSLIEDVTSTIQPLVDKNSNKLVIDIDPQAGTLEADETKVRQTLFNLLSNACKFTDQGTITLRVQRKVQKSGDRLVFQVSDTGIGMSPEQMAKVFDEFTQADSSTTRKFGGTGLGLTISKKFCQLMGGDVDVKSEEGRGTVFTVDLPAVGSEPAAPRSVIDSGSQEIPEGAQTVLVIDDDATTLDLTQRYLAREGLTVVTAAGGVRGLELAKQIKPSVITLDVMMPGMDGWAVLTALKKDPETADIPVIMMTMIDEKEMGFALGASEYMSKPVDRRRLTTHLEKYLGSSRHGSGRLLLIEDESETREVLLRGLEKDGWTINAAENGLVALAQLTDVVPDLILLDLAMPQMDGFEFLSELRGSEQWRDIPVVVVTSEELTEDESSRLDGKVEAVLRKGKRDSLLAELRDLVTECVARGTAEGASRNA